MSPHRPAPPSAEHGVTTASVVLISAFVAFAAVIAYLVVSSLLPRDAPVFEPTPVDPSARASDTVGDTVTIDGRDTQAWRFFDFDRRSPVLPPDTAGWDLAFRRFTVVAAGGALDLGEVDFASVTDVPSQGYIQTTFAHDTVNAALDHWYSYSMLSHLLQPNGHVYAIRTREARYAKIEFLSYYCPGVVAGCPTFRYVYQPAGATDF
jgi:hypothetical protein